MHGIWISLEEHTELSEAALALIKNCAATAVHVISIVETNITCQFTKII